ncbi:hypothetical protein [Alkalisalibacterium limincola]|uniref:Secreted protein n=1 Tax=Alkalisalibacterium limincola TaxID=2699169 RepID=A0A5C8L120_9GAMM|nr:hypothetical protein [Alkalisalibacterium limincola]TXK65843.1 hypothetical protein FU658_01735 [Alkalisalibacterium limincola]
MLRNTLLSLTAAILVMGMVPQASAADVRCEMRFNMSGWSLFYKKSSGTGTITCNNGQSMNVALEARGGGLSFGKSTIENGVGEFSPVDNINELLGGYASAEAHAGAGGSAKGQVVTKGPVSLALSGTGRGVDLGVAFGSFIISAR